MRAMIDEDRAVLLHRAAGAVDDARVGERDDRITDADVGAQRGVGRGRRGQQVGGRGVRLGGQKAGEQGENAVHRIVPLGRGLSQAADDRDSERARGGEGGASTVASRTELPTIAPEFRAGPPAS